MYFLDESIKYDQGSGVLHSEETFSVILTEMDRLSLEAKQVDFQVPLQ